MENQDKRAAERRILKDVACLDDRLLKPSYISDQKLAQLFYRASEYNRACRMRMRSAILTAFAAAGTVAAVAMNAPEYGVSTFALAFGAGSLCFVSHSAVNLNRRRLEMMAGEIRAFDDLVQQGHQDVGQSPAPTL